MNKFKNSNRYDRPIHVSSLYKFRLPKFNMPAAPLPQIGLTVAVVSYSWCQSPHWQKTEQKRRMNTSTLWGHQAEHQVEQTCSALYWCCCVLSSERHSTSKGFGMSGFFLGFNRVRRSSATRNMWFAFAGASAPRNVLYDLKSSSSLSRVMTWSDSFFVEPPYEYYTHRRISRRLNQVPGKIRLCMPQ